MNVTLLKSLVTLVPTLMLVSGSVLLYSREKTLTSLAQLFGAACLLLVVLAHVCEALNVLPALRWGRTTALVTGSTCGAPSLVSRCSRWATYFMRSAGSVWPNRAFNQTRRHMP